MHARRLPVKIAIMVGEFGALEREDVAVLRGATLFSEVSSEVIETFLATASVRLLQNREILFRPPQSADQIFIVLRGKIQVYRGETAGKHAVLSVFLPGSAVALDAGLAQGIYGMTAEAVGICRLLEIPAQAFREALASGGALSASVVQVLAQNLDEAFQQLERIQLKPTSQRLADFLLSLINVRSGTAELVLPYEKALIANYLGMEPESLSRALKDLQDLGVANRGRRVQIADVSQLRTFSRRLPANNRAA